MQQANIKLWLIRLATTRLEYLPCTRQSAQRRMSSQPPAYSSGARLARASIDLPNPGPVPCQSSNFTNQPGPAGVGRLV